MPYFILALTFGAVGLSSYQYFTPDTSSYTSIHLSFDLLWLPLLGIWFITFWNETIKSNQTLSRLKIFLITPLLATLTLGITQLNWGLEIGLLLSKDAMLTKAHSLNGKKGHGPIGLFHFSEYRIRNADSVFVLTPPPYRGAHTGFYYSDKPFEESILQKVAEGMIAESYSIPMDENWTYWHIKYKYTGL